MAASATTCSPHAVIINENNVVGVMMTRCIIWSNRLWQVEHLSLKLNLKYLFRILIQMQMMSYIEVFLTCSFDMVLVFIILKFYVFGM